MAQLSATIGALVTLVQTLTVPATTPRQTALLTPGGARIEPVERLFRPTTPVPPPPGPVMRTAPRVVCGTTVVPVDPAVDPRILRPVPTGVTFSMRTVAPAICVD